jgi:type VI secretion system protein ImpM
VVIPLPGAPVSGLAVFAFGKLPAHGDFVARGLAAAERQAWDDWASAGIVRARDALGDAFDAAHDRAQPCRFAFGAGSGGAGLFGGGRQAGAFAPSIDQAGRRFLIVLGTTAPAGFDPHGRGAEAAEILEAEIYGAFQAGVDVNGLVANATAALAGFDAGPPYDGSGRFWTLGAEPGEALEIAADQPPADLLPRLFASLEPSRD